ncbi:MAG TPA: OsmC family protein [Gemmatimonadaceae bacterium]|nr:OsmC family protein [Gemmatimonadaceae bacterium]
MAKPNEVIVRTGDRGYVTEIMARGHLLIADEPASVGGTDMGPTPYDYLLASLGACTAMTLRIYADRRGWPLEDVAIRLWQSRVYEKDCEECEVSEVGIEQIEREIDMAGPLTEEQQEGLIRIADRCPVGQTLARGIRIVPARAVRLPGEDGASGDIAG